MSVDYETLKENCEVDGSLQEIHIEMSNLELLQTDKVSVAETEVEAGR